MIEEAIKNIAAGIPAGERVRIAYKNRDKDYSVSRSELWVTSEGKLIWRYASGCSCWDGKYSEEHVETIKEFATDPNDWEYAVLKYAETGEEQDI